MAMAPLRTTRKPLPVWLTFVSCGVAGMALAALYSFRQPNRYTSQAVLVRAERLSDVVGRDPGSPPAAFTGTSWPSSELTRLLMLTEVVQMRVRERLAQTRETTNPPIVSPALKVERNAGGQWILSATSPSFTFSQDYAKAWAYEFVEFSKQQQRGSVGAARANLERQILEYERHLERHVTERETFLQEHGLGSVADAEAGLEASLEQILHNLRELETNRERLTHSLPEVTNSERLLELRFEVKRLENRIAQLPAEISPATRAEHERELRLKRADLDSFVALLEEARLARINALDRDLATLSERAKKIRAAILESSDTRRQLGRLIEDEQLTGENLSAIKRQQASMGRISLDEEEFMIVVAGTGTPGPTGPNRTAMLLAGSALGVFAGVAWLGVRRRIRRTAPAIPGETPAPTRS